MTAVKKNAQRFSNIQLVGDSLLVQVHRCSTWLKSQWRFRCLPLGGSASTDPFFDAFNERLIYEVKNAMNESEVGFSVRCLSLGTFSRIRIFLILF